MIKELAKKIINLDESEMREFCLELGRLTTADCIVFRNFGRLLSIILRDKKQ